MRPLTIDLDGLAQALSSRNPACYLDLLSGRLLPFDGDPELGRELESEPERYLAIEPLESRDGYQLMEEFLASVRHPHAYHQLSHALAGRKPVRAFRHVLAEYPELERAWAEFEAARLRELAIAWLADNDLHPLGLAL